MTPHRKTIGESPLDAIVPREEPRPDPPPAPQPTSSRRSLARKPQEVKETAKKGKERLTVHLPADVADRAKNAVYWTPGLTLAGLAEAALLKAVERLEKERGGPFPPRAAELKGGRPMK